MELRILFAILGGLAVLACGGEDGASPAEQTPSPAATAAPATPAPATPAGITSTDYWFRGVVTEMNTACYYDALCSVTVEVMESLGGTPLDEGAEVVVIESYGFSPRRCDGEWSETPPGTEVEVLAHAADGDTLAVCEGERYFVRELLEE